MEESEMNAKIEETEKSKFRTTRAFDDDGGSTISERKRISSPSRRYIAICNTGNWDGHYFKSFTLPESISHERELVNNTDEAAWYFLNVLDHYACIEKCVTEEDFYNLSEANGSDGMVSPKFGSWKDSGGEWRKDINELRMMCNSFTCVGQLGDFFLHGIGKWTDVPIAANTKRRMEAIVRKYNEENR